MMISTYEEETAIIGAICQKPKLIRVVARHVEPRHFLHESCRTVYEYALETDSDGKAFDALIAADALKDKIPEVRNFLAECMEVVPTTANTEEYAKLLREKADEIDFRERVGMELGEERGGKLTESIAAICAEQIQNRAGGGLKKWSDILTRTYDGLFQRAVNRVDTGYGKLDGLLKGMWGGELIIVAARPAVGKSAFALSVAENAGKAKKVVHYYSLEMEDTENGERAIARHTKKVSMNELIERNISDDTYDPKTLNDMCDDIVDSMTEIAGLPIYIDDSPNCKPSKVRAQALMEKDLGLIIVDYGGLMSSDRRYDSRNLELGAISRDLKNIAKELQVPVIMLGQLNRGVGDSQKPTLRELRDSGELEQNANKCIFLWNINKEDGFVGVSVAKNRRGKTGEVVMQFDGEHMRFYETDQSYEETNEKRNKSGFSQDNE